MSEKKPVITPEIKLGELLDAYPDLEEILLELSPAFSKLKNPILRKTVARVATLQQVAVVGGLAVDGLVNRLRKEAGQDASDNASGDGACLVVASLPGWFQQASVKKHYDARPVINSGGSPMAEILGIVNKLGPGEWFELTTPFVPAPIIDLLREKGFTVFPVRKEDTVLSYIGKEER